MTAIDWDNELHDPAWVTDRVVHSGVMWGPNVLVEVYEYWTEFGVRYVDALFDMPEAGLQRVRGVSLSFADVWITYEDSWYDDFD